MEQASTGTAIGKVGGKVVSILNASREIVNLESEIERLSRERDRKIETIEVLVSGKTIHVTNVVNGAPAKARKTNGKGNASRLVAAMSADPARTWTTDDAQKIMRGSSRAVVASALSALFKKKKIARLEQGVYQWYQQGESK